MYDILKSSVFGKFGRAAFISGGGGSVGLDPALPLVYRDLWEAVRNQVLHI